MFSALKSENMHRPERHFMVFSPPLTTTLSLLCSVDPLFLLLPRIPSDSPAAKLALYELLPLFPKFSQLQSLNYTNFFYLLLIWNRLSLQCQEKPGKPQAPKISRESNLERPIVARSVRSLCYVASSASSTSSMTASDWCIIMSHWASSTSSTGQVS